MAQVIWTIPALNDLERILEYIELDNETAARKLAQKAFEATDKLTDLPESGSKSKELRGTPYRRLIVGPLLIYHRKASGHVLSFMCAAANVDSACAIFSNETDFPRSRNRVR